MVVLGSGPPDRGHAYRSRSQEPGLLISTDRGRVTGKHRHVSRGQQILDSLSKKALELVRKILGEKKMVVVKQNLKSHQLGLFNM